jgi:hypothetical protein
MNVKLLNTELEALGTIEKIQFGVAPGCMAQVIVPAFLGPLDDASGTEPSPPGTVTVPGLVTVVVGLPLVLQAASPARLATAMATPAVLTRNFIDPPSLRCRRFWSVLGSSACRPSFSKFAGGCAPPPSRGHWAAASDPAVGDGGFV